MTVDCVWLTLRVNEMRNVGKRGESGSLRAGFLVWAEVWGKSMGG